MGGSDRREHAAEDLEAQVFLVAETVRTALDDAHLVVEPLDKAECDFVLDGAVGRDAVPVTLDHLREFLVGLKALPLEGLAPVLEEAPGPSRARVVPELAEGLLEHIGGVEAPVRGQQQLERLAAFERQVLTTREECVLLALDEAPVLAREAGLLALAHGVQGLAEVAQHVTLVEQDAGLWGVGLGGVPERLPHVHHRHPNPRALLGPQPLEEFVHAGLGTILAPKPDRPLPDQVADHDPIDVSLLDRDLIDADHLRCWGPRPLQLLPHVLLLEVLHGVPVEVQLLGNVLDRRGATTTAHIEGEAFRIRAVVREERQRLLSHRAARNAFHAPYLDVQEDSEAPAPQIPHPLALPVVEAPVLATTRARGFFERR